MKQEENYLEINKDSWNKRTASHLTSDFYDVEGFLNGKNSLNSIELDLLGDVKGKRILHLQCHFGQDSLSLARMGATVTGVDLSNNAINAGKELAKKMDLDVQFIACDVYDLPQHLDAEFDIVFTSYGTIGWLPDMNKWAALIARYLKPGGHFVFAEFHPVVWMFDDDFKIIKYNYSNSGPILENEEGTYADKTADIQQDYVMWNHGLAEVLTALLSNKISIQKIQEFDYSPYDCFDHTIEFEPRKYRIKHLDDKIPMVYALLGKMEV
ncbi:MAG: methyltransferase domain-containing protein [Crocinitomix sp.]|nr:methyltransferase domain-containing protein [Crocinitomix sp.]